MISSSRKKITAIYHGRQLRVDVVFSCMGDRYNRFYSFLEKALANKPMAKPMMMPMLTRLMTMPMPRPNKMAMAKAIFLLDSLYPFLSAIIYSLVAQ